VAHGAIGVADGVSAWAEDGIDPGDYSRTLAQYCAEAVEEKTGVKGFDPRAVLRHGQMCTYKPGSATMVVAALQPGGMLHIANLGDCGVRVVRKGAIVLATEVRARIKEGVGGWGMIW
jgi:serine/threonine protein phosphatase PrpC